jgi:hypothetical protein
MKRIILAACAAGFFALISGHASAQQPAQQSWVGMMDFTATTDGNGHCGQDKGSKSVINYRPYLSAGDPPSAVVVTFNDLTIYMQNRDATSQFDGTGHVRATLITTGNEFGMFHNVKGSYTITLDPVTIDAETTTIKIPTATVKLNIAGVTKCVFKFRGILTPAPVQN